MAQADLRPLGGRTPGVEIPVDEYARQNELTIDFLSYNPSSEVTPAASLLLQSTCLGQAEDDDLLPKLHIPFRLSPDEPPVISKDSVNFLNSVARREDDEVVMRRAIQTSCASQIRHLKMELPLLESDHEADWRKLLRDVRSTTSVNLYSNMLPFEPLEISSDEAPQYPESAYSFRSQLQLDARNYQLVLTHDTLRYLATALAIDKNTDVQERLLLDGMSHHKPIASREITPPVSPLLMPKELYTPGSDRCQIPFASDPSSLLEDDLKAAQSVLFAASSPPILGIPDLPPASEVETLTPVTRSTESLKVEQPLIPSNPISSPKKHTIDLREAAGSVNLACDTDCDLEHYARKDIPELFSDELLEELKASAFPANMAVEQERLEHADAIARVQAFGMAVTKWKGNHRERDYWWAPFPSSLRLVSFDESLDGDTELIHGDLLRMLNDAEFSTAASYVWKRPGLAILRELDNEDEEEVLQVGGNGEPTGSPGIQTLLRKRKFELDTADRDTSLPLINASDVNPVRHPNQAQSTDTARRTNLLVGNDDPNATSALLANYVDLHTSKRRKNEISSFFSPRKPVQAEMKAIIDRRIENHTKDNGSSLSAMRPIEKLKSAPVPSLGEPSGSTKIIVTLSLGPGMLGWIEKLLPEAELIERDFDRWNTVAWDRNMVSRSPIISHLAAEADVIVSPATGIILTSLLKVIQKPLPGQKSETAIRGRIEKVSTRYERLIVLVSQANRVDESTRDLSASECASFAGFSGFVLGLNPDSQVYFVGGGEETLSKWLVALIRRHSPEAAEVQSLLLEEETTWELILRRAGMNAYAAQIILAELKAITIRGPQGQAMGELQRFILMTPQERIAQFSPLMGGSNVLARVGSVIDAQWE
ncbi:uncharacterized protein PG998_004020 [Apiospora kogelbergensis]|uniref:uncharacterized protein n=1 Tax=Apiospora kogelbergensis TaxID=1337665 RepID=UPI00313126AB